MERSHVSRWKQRGIEKHLGATYLDGRVSRQSTLELLEPAGDLVAQGRVALLVVDLPAEQAAALGGGVGSVLAGHFGVVGVLFCFGFFGGQWVDRGEDF